MKKNIFTLSVLALASLGLFSCGNDEQDAMISTVTLRSNTVINSESTVSPGLIGGATLSNATLRLREIGIVQVGDNATNSVRFGDGSSQQITLLNLGLPTSPESLGSAVINHNEYDRLTMRLDRGAQLPDGDPLKNRSLVISGTVNGRIMHIYTNVEQIVTRELSGGPYSINSDEDLILTINFNTLFNGIALTDAVDGNEDGTIEIEPDGIDGIGNLAIHGQIVQNLAAAFAVTRQ